MGRLGEAARNIALAVGMLSADAAVVNAKPKEKVEVKQPKETAGQKCLRDLTYFLNFYVTWFNNNKKSTLEQEDGEKIIADMENECRRQIKIIKDQEPTWGKFPEATEIRKTIENAENSPDFPYLQK